MRKLLFVFILYFFTAPLAADTLKCIIEYTNTTSGSPHNMNIKMYKNGTRFKLVRMLSTNPDERGIVTTVLDVSTKRVISITEKDGKKKGVRTNFDEDKYFDLILEYKILFNGVPKGKSFKNFTKKTGTELFMNKECEVYESGISFLGISTKYFMWNNIMLKEESPGSSTTAVSIEESPVFNENEFGVPADVEWFD